MPPCIRCRKEMREATPFCPWCGAKQERTNKRHRRGNGQGTVFQPKGKKTWTARVTVGYVTGEDGHIIQKRHEKHGFKTQTDAIKYCNQYTEAMASPKKAPTLQHYWDLYSADELLSLSGDKQYAYKGAWRKMKALHLKPVDKITVSDLRETVSEKAKTYYTIKDMKTVLSHLFFLASADGFASKDLPDHIILPHLEETSPEPFTDIEQAALWKQYESGDKDAAIPLIMIYTGMMTGEMRKLTVDMIDMDNAQIVGIGMKTNVRKKATVFLPDAIIPVVEDVCAGKTKKVFPWGEKKFYDTYYAVLERAGCRRLTPYSCRHTTATALAVTEGIAPQTVKKVMRWSSTRMMDRYVHPSNEDAKAAINTLKKGYRRGVGGDDHPVDEKSI